MSASSAPSARARPRTRLPSAGTATPSAASASASCSPSTRLSQDQLTDLLRKARVGEPPKTATDAALGTVITIAFDGDEDDTEKFLLGSREIAGTTELSVYSPESALGAAILGAKPGSSVTYTAPNGKDITVKVLAVEPFVP